MRILLKILLSSLLLVLIIAVGTEVAALHRNDLPPPDSTAPPVVVRKSTTAPVPLKVVRPVMGHPPAFFWLRKGPKPKAPANPPGPGVFGPSGARRTKGDAPSQGAPFWAAWGQWSIFGLPPLHW